MRRNAINAREAGFALIARINRWLIAGAVVLAGGISLVAARSFHGHSTASAATVSRSSGSNSSSSAGSSSSSASGGLQAPAQTPTASAPASQSPAVSGGS